MNVCISDHNTKKSFYINALAASDMIGVESKELYNMYHKGITEYKHFSIVWDVIHIKNKPRGKSYKKGQSGYLTAILSKAK